MIKLSNSIFTLAINEEIGKIVEFSNAKGSLISSNQPPLMSLCFRTEAGAEIRTDVTNAKSISKKQIEGGYALTYWDFPKLSLTATIKITYDDNSNKINFNTEIKSDMQLEWYELPGIAVPDTFEDNGGNSNILWPYNEGALITNITARENSGLPYCEPCYPSVGNYSMYPGMLSTPMIAVCGDMGGVYLATHDKSNNTKHIDFIRYEGGVKLIMRVYPGVLGGNYESDFDTVLAAFQGDWHDAAEIYRDWFNANKPDPVKKVAENPNLPDWYGESPIVLTYCVRGHHDTDIMHPNELFPYINGMKFVDEFAEKLNSKIMVILMHWEGSAPWAPPYVWPPYGGEAALKEYIDALHQKGHVFGVYCSGFGWTQQSNIDDYNMEKEFEEKGLARYMCVSPEGELPLSKICNGQRYGYDLCPSQNFCKETLKNEVMQMASAGIDYVQLLDQNHGGTAYMCYSKEHGHPPVPGKWQSQAVLDIMNSIKAEINNKKMLFGCESAASEVFIPALSFSDNRFEINYIIGRPVPLYSYLYHEYLNNFMGNQVCGEGIINVYKSPYSLNYRMAYSFVAGDLITLVINERGEPQWAWGQSCFSKHHLPKPEPVFTLAKNMNAVRMGIAKKYLLGSKMLKPLGITCDTEIEIYAQSGVIKALPIHTARYEAESGDIGQVIVNYTNEPVTVKVADSVGLKLLDGVSETVLQSEKITIQPLSVVLIEG